MADDQTRESATPRYRIWILGGVGEFGRNCTVIEDSHGKLLVIDAGIMFPGPDLPGVNRIIPDFDVLTTRARDIEALLITHGHEDHIGGVPQFVDHVGPSRILLSPLALGLVERKLSELQLEVSDLVAVQPLDTVQLGDFEVTFFSANHSIPQTMGILVQVEGDYLYFTGDFRLDDIPLLGHRTDHSGLLKHLGGRPVRFMFVDSTNAGQSGHTRNEASVLTTLRPAIGAATGRVFFTTFASHLERQFQAILLAEEYGRHVYVAGRAMQRNVVLARKLGLFDFPSDLLVERSQLALIPSERLMVLASGSQAEPGSFLDRLSTGSQPGLELGDKDLIVMSSVPIPGNEPRITRMIDRFMRTGANVLHYRDAHVHVSGHARNDEIASIVHAVAPTCVVPVHGDHYNLVRCAEVVERTGPAETLTLRTGQIVDVYANDYSVAEEEVSSRHVFVDDHSDDIPESIVRERRALRDQGALVVNILNDANADSYQLHSVTRLGFSGDNDIEALVQRALGRLDNHSDPAKVIRACRDAIYRDIAGPRGSQARVVIQILTVRPPDTVGAALVEEAVSL